MEHEHVSYRFTYPFCCKNSHSKCDIILPLLLIKEVIFLKLYYNKKLRDPIYYIQDTIRTPKGPRSVQVKRIGKHSELLRTVDDPLAYAQQILRQMNAEAAKPDGRKKAVLTIDLNKKVEYSKPDQISSQSAALNVGYFTSSPSTPG